jgi:hypothetical protein
MHNLIRAVAPPYPGAFCDFRTGPSSPVLRSRTRGEIGPTTGRPTLFCRDGNLYAECGDGGFSRLLAVELSGSARPISPATSSTPDLQLSPPPVMKKILILGVNGFIGHHLSQRIMATTDWEVYGMDMNSERVSDLMDNPRFHFFEGDITINKEWIEYHVKKCDVILPLVAIATPATYVKEPLRVFELDFEANLPIIRQAVKYKKRVIFPVDLRGLRHEPGPGVRPREFAADLRPDQQAALDLRLRQADDGPGDPRLRPAGGPAIHPVPPLQLDRPGPRFDPYAEGRQLARHHPVPRPHRARRTDQAGRWRRAEALLHLCHDGIDALMKIIENKDGIANGKIYNIGNPRTTTRSANSPP